MKKVIAGCIDLMLEFDSASELDRYIADIEAKKQEYSIVDRKELPGDRIMIRIHRQYNKSPFPTTEGVFPWGYAIHTSDNRWVYFINAKRFAEIEGVKV